MPSDIKNDAVQLGDLTKKIRFTNILSTTLTSVSKAIRKKFTNHPTGMQKKKSSPLHIHFDDRHAHCVHEPPKDVAIPAKYKVEVFN